MALGAGGVIGLVYVVEIGAPALGAGEGIVFGVDAGDGSALKAKQVGLVALAAEVFVR